MQTLYTGHLTFAGLEWNNQKHISQLRRMENSTKSSPLSKDEFQGFDAGGGFELKAVGKYGQTFSTLTALLQGNIEIFYLQLVQFMFLY